MFVNTNRVGLHSINLCWSLLKDYINWKCRTNYIQILEDFLQNKITFDEFKN